MWGIYWHDCEVIVAERPLRSRTWQVSFSIECTVQVTFRWSTENQMGQEWHWISRRLYILLLKWECWLSLFCTQRCHISSCKGSDRMSHIILRGHSICMHQLRIMWWYNGQLLWGTQECILAISYVPHENFITDQNDIFKSTIGHKRLYKISNDNSRPAQISHKFRSHLQNLGARKYTHMHASTHIYIVRNGKTFM
jgi:hypothetical protein